MATDWNMWKEKAINLTKMGVGKAKELGEIARLNLENLSEEDKIRKALLEIGQRYMDQHPDGPEPGYEELFARVKASNESIAENKERIANIQKDGNLSDEEVAKVEEELALESPEEKLET